MSHKLSLFSLFLLIHWACYSQENLTPHLNQAMIPLSTIEAESGFEDLLLLKEIFKEVQIVGAGESTHGTKEFFQAKHRLFEFLVREMDFKVFVIEGFFVGTEKANNYIQGKEIDPYESVISMGFGIWYTEEMLDLLNWMRDYNKGKADDEKLSIYGCDMQGYKETAIRMQEVLGANELLSDDIKDGLTRLATKEAGEYLSKSDLKQLTSIADQIEGLLNSSNLTNKATLLQYNRILQQYLTQAETRSSTYVDLHDQFMAENVKWIYDLEGGKKMFLWEHNQHIMKTKDNKGFTPMGQHLQAMYGEAYYALGLCFGHGTFRAAHQQTQRMEEIEFQTDIKNSVEETFAKSNAKYLIIDFASLDTSEELNALFQKPMKMRSIGQNYSQKNDANYFSESVWSQSFDGLLFIAESTGSNALDFRKLWTK